MADVKYRKQAKAVREVVMAKEDPRDKAFSRELAMTVKQELKPEFDQINSRFDNVENRLTGLETSSKDIQTKVSKTDARLANLEASNGDIQNKLSQIINKLG